MIKFFRKIRHSLIKENRVTKYLVYAIGEIILVVIGILIAISINNANDDRKEGKELANYLTKISNDVTRDIEQIKSLKIRRDSVRSKAILAYDELIKVESDQIQVIRGGYSVFYEFYFIPNTSGFEAIKSSSFLGRINNTKLDSLLISYYAAVDNVVNREKGFNTFIEEMEADMKTSIDILPNQTIDISEFHPDLLKNDTRESKLRTDMPNELMPMFKNNSFRAAIGRVVGDATYDKRYSELINKGNDLVYEIRNYTNDE